MDTHLRLISTLAQALAIQRQHLLLQARETHRFCGGIGDVVANSGYCGQLGSWWNIFAASCPAN